MTERKYKILIILKIGLFSQTCSSSSIMSRSESRECMTMGRSSSAATAACRRKTAFCCWACSQNLPVDKNNRPHNNMVSVISHVAIQQCLGQLHLSEDGPSPPFWGQSAYALLPSASPNKPFTSIPSVILLFPSLLHWEVAQDHQSTASFPRGIHSGTWLQKESGMVATILVLIAGINMSTWTKRDDSSEYNMWRDLLI